MCGITGIHGKQDRRFIKTMNEKLIHRGPDGFGVYSSDIDDISIAMRRLAIIDISGGNQPFINERKGKALVYNGEIFNAEHIRKDLLRQGERFETTNSDTEVLFILLQKYGIESVTALNGMFAFAYLLRDRLGIKPIYYTKQSGYFAFASEIKSLISLPFVRKDVNKRSVQSYLGLGFVTDSLSIYEGIYSLDPGCCLSYNLETKEIKINRWWIPVKKNNFNINPKDWVAETQAKLEEAVSSWSCSDVGISASLSGGLDSATIVSMAARQGREIETFSLGFNDKQEKRLDELALAREISDKFGTQHNEIILTAHDVAESIIDIVKSLEQPYAGGIPSWFIYKAASQVNKVILTGVGGDELFGNYGKWQTLRKKNWLMQSTYERSITFQEFNSKYYSKISPGSKLVDSVVCEDIKSESLARSLYARFKQNNSNDIRDSVLLLDISTQLPDEFLMMTDRFSMAHSIEARTPLLDNRLIDLVLSIPANQRVREQDPKSLLRMSVRNILPNSVLWAKKKGFVIPFGSWIKRDLKQFIDYYLSESKLSAIGIFSPRVRDEILMPHYHGKVDNGETIFKILMLQMWYSCVFENDL